MNDEFNKLDTFMRQHLPPAVNGQAKTVPQSTPWWIPFGSLATLVLVILVMGGVFGLENERNIEAYTLIETMEWEQEAEVDPDEVGDFLAMVE